MWTCCAIWVATAHASLGYPPSLDPTASPGPLLALCASVLLPLCALQAGGRRIPRCLGTRPRHVRKLPLQARGSGSTAHVQGQLAVATLGTALLAGSRSLAPPGHVMDVSRRHPPPDGCDARLCARPRRRRPLRAAPLCLAAHPALLRPAA